MGLLKGGFEWSGCSSRETMIYRAQLSDQTEIGLGVVGQDCIPNTQHAEAGVLLELLEENLAQAVLETHPQ